VLNPFLSVSDGFKIKSFYDGVLVDASDESTLLNRTITFSPQASALQVTNIDFEP
jgi:hypothetical protein